MASTAAAQGPHQGCTWTCSHVDDHLKARASATTPKPACTWLRKERCKLAVIRGRGPRETNYPMAVAGCRKHHVNAGAKAHSADVCIHARRPMQPPRDARLATQSSSLQLLAPSSRGLVTPRDAPVQQPHVTVLCAPPNRACILRYTAAMPAAIRLLLADSASPKQRVCACAIAGSCRASAVPPPCKMHRNAPLSTVPAAPALQPPERSIDVRQITRRARAARASCLRTAE